jgi:hypothetical protein
LNGADRGRAERHSSPRLARRHRHTLAGSSGPRRDRDAKCARDETSADEAERQRLAEEIQRGILENHYPVPVFRHAAVAAIGPRVAAQRWQDVFPTITTAYAYPWEDIKLRE